MKALILTEGGKEFGYGHIVRCLSLKHAFSNYDIPVDMMVDSDVGVLDILENEEGVIYRNWKTHQEPGFEEFDFCVIDSYTAAKDVYEIVSQKITVCLFFDDYTRIDYPEGIILKNSLKLNHKLKDKDVLNGYDYLPLRKFFWKSEPKLIKPEIRDVYISFGASKKINFSVQLEEILKAIKEKIPYAQSNVFISDSFGHKEILEKFSANHISGFNEQDFLVFLHNVDLCITAGGQSLLESLAMGVPSIAFVLANNQMESIEGLINAQVIKYAGNLNDLSFNLGVTTSIDYFKSQNNRINYSEKSRRLIDGRGALRVVKYALKKYFDEHLQIRRASLTDMQRVYDLSNNKLVRKVSFNSEPIPFEDHRRWFESKLKDENCTFLIVQVNDEFVGQIRFEKELEKAYISLSIVEEYQGKGIGKNMFIEGLKFLPENISKVVAFVKTDNTQSKSFFEKLGFFEKKIVTLKNHQAFLFEYEFER